MVIMWLGYLKVRRKRKITEINTAIKRIILTECNMHKALKKFIGFYCAGGFFFSYILSMLHVFQAFWGSEHERRKENENITYKCKYVLLSCDGSLACRNSVKGKKSREN